MTKFNVGDKVRFIEDYSNYKIGDVVEVTGFWSEGIDFAGEHGDGSSLYERFELAELTINENQRIAELENEVAELKVEVAELKLIVHELQKQQRVENIYNIIEGVKPPEVNIKNAPAFMTAKEGVELGELISKGLADGLNGVLEFEGRQYRKVDREARKGDVVVFDSKIYPHNAEPNKPYIVNRETCLGVAHSDRETAVHVKFEIYDNGRTPKNVDVYELIEGGLNT